MSLEFQLTDAAEEMKQLRLAIVELTRVMQTQTVLVEMPADPAVLVQQQLQNRVADEALQKIADNIPPFTDVPNAKSSTTTDTSPPSSNESRTVTYDDVKNVTIAVSKIDKAKAVAGLARFGVQTAKSLTEDQWLDYVVYMGKVAAGEIDPEQGEQQ